MASKMPPEPPPKLAIPPVPKAKKISPRVVPNKEKRTVRQGTSVGKKSYAAEAYKRGNFGKPVPPVTKMKALPGMRPPIPEPTVKDKETGLRRPDKRSTYARRASMKMEGKAAYAAAKAARETAAKKAARVAMAKGAARFAGGLGLITAIPEVLDMVKKDRENVKAVLDKRRAANMAAMKKAAPAPKPAKPKTALQKSQDKFMADYIAKAKGGKAISGAESKAMAQLARAKGGGNFVGPKIVGPRKK